MARRTRDKNNDGPRRIRSLVKGDLPAVGTNDAAIGFIYRLDVFRISARFFFKSYPPTYIQRSFQRGRASRKKNRERDKSIGTLSANWPSQLVASLRGIRRPPPPRSARPLTISFVRLCFLLSSFSLSLALLG